MFEFENYTKSNGFQEPLIYDFNGKLNNEEYVKYEVTFDNENKKVIISELLKGKFKSRPTKNLPTVKPIDYSEAEPILLQLLYWWSHSIDGMAAESVNEGKNKLLKLNDYLNDTLKFLRIAHISKAMEMVEKRFLEHMIEILKNHIECLINTRQYEIALSALYYKNKALNPLKSEKYLPAIFDITSDNSKVKKIDEKIEELFHALLPAIINKKSNINGFKRALCQDNVENKIDFCGRRTGKSNIVFIFWVKFLDEYKIIDGLYLKERLARVFIVDGKPFTISDSYISQARKEFTKAGLPPIKQKLNNILKIFS
jgi:hypothetical protein